MRSWAVAVFLPMLLLGCAQPTKEQALFDDNCASCHAPGRDPRAPDPNVLAALPPSAILQSVESGKMQAYGASLTPEERNLLAHHLGAKTGEVPLSFCESRKTPRVSPIYWSGFSPDLENRRHQGVARAGLEPETLDDLELAWAFALPASGDVRTQPAVLGDLVVMGNTDGRVFALDRETGCVVWTYRGRAAVRTPIGAYAEGQGTRLVFGDASAFVTVLDAATGELRWRRRVHDNHFAMLTGAPVPHAGRIYVPVSSWELVAAIDPGYPCCTFKGAVVALDAKSGEPVWDTPMGELPVLQEKRSLAADRYGPSGAPVWTSPAVDPVRGALYVGTGENYSSPADGWSDAIVALDMETGRPRWVRQATRDDAFNWGCAVPLHPNCPDEDGPDLDFGASPILVERPGGGSLLLAGQKSGVVHALDPDREGEVVWKRRVGRGGMLGGVHWGMTVVGEHVYAPVSDRPDGQEYEDPARPGLVALDIDTGEVAWQVDLPGDCPGEVPGCHAGISAPASSAGDRVLTGGLDGHLRIFDAATGQVVYDRDLRQKFPGAPAEVRGGAVDAAGPVVAGGLVLVNSGYPQHDQTPGNALFALRPRR